MSELDGFAVLIEMDLCGWITDFIGSLFDTFIVYPSGRRHHFLILPKDMLSVISAIDGLIADII